MPQLNASITYSQVDLLPPPARTRHLALRVQGVPVVVAGLTSPIRARLVDLLAPFVVDAPTPRRSGTTAPAIRVNVRSRPEGDGWVVSQSDNHRRRRLSDTEELLSHLEWLVVSRAIAASSAGVAFHGAALTRGDETVLLLADSGVGKTTLTLGLMERGWLPLTDDIMFVDRDTLTLSAFPRCFHMAQHTEALLSEHVLFEHRGRLQGYVYPVQWAETERLPTRIFAVQRCETCPSSRYSMLQAEAAGVLLAQALENQLSVSQIARIAAGVAGNARGCYRLRNGHLQGALNLIEGVEGK